MDQPANLSAKNILPNRLVAHGKTAMSRTGKLIELCAKPDTCKSVELASLK
jgi:hypothetical protein